MCVCVGGDESTDLHGIKRQVGGDLKLLNQQLLSDVVDADKPGQAPSQDGLAVSRVTQRRERPEETTPACVTQAFLANSSSVGWSPHSLPLSQLLGCDFICVLAARLQVMASGHRACLCGRVGVPERNLAIQGGDC